MTDDEIDPRRKWCKWCHEQDPDPVCSSYPAHLPHCPNCREKEWLPVLRSETKGVKFVYDKGARAQLPASKGLFD